MVAFLLRTRSLGQPIVDAESGVRNSAFGFERVKVRAVRRLRAKYDKKVVDH